jgi:hypothetical protein
MQGGGSEALGEALDGHEDGDRGEDNEGECRVSQRGGLGWLVGLLAVFVKGLGAPHLVRSLVALVWLGCLVCPSRLEEAALVTPGFLFGIPGAAICLVAEPVDAV